MGSRYVLGWGAVLALSVGASAGTLVLVRQAIGDGNLVDPLSQAQVRSQYADALHPSATATRPPSGSSTSTSANAPSTTPNGTTTHRPPTSSASTAPGRHTTSGTSSQPHPGGSGSSSHTTSPPPPSSVTRVLTSSGGSVVVRCTWSGSGGSGQVYLVSWSPAQGYAVNDVQRGPSGEAEIEFESGSSSVSVSYHCSSSGPVQQVETGGAWGGGGGGDDGGDPGDGGGGGGG